MYLMDYRSLFSTIGGDETLLPCGVDDNKAIAPALKNSAWLYERNQNLH